MSSIAIINNKRANIKANKSDSEKWTIDKSTHDTLKVLDKLFEFYDSSVKYEKGITIINPISTVQLVSDLSISRPSNHIGVIRHELPSNTILTYNVEGDRVPKYGFIKSDKNIENIKKLRERMLQHISRNKK